MTGTTLQELTDKLLHGHEAEFTYNGQEYSIEPELRDGTSVIKIWKCSAEPQCIAEATVQNETDLEVLFKTKCFLQKSFLEIENQIIVESIF